MKKQNEKQNKRPLYVYVLVIIAYLASILLPIADIFMIDDYDIAIGMVAQRTYQAHREIENVYITGIRREQAAALVPLPQFNSDEVTTAVLDDVELLFGQLGYLRGLYMPIIGPAPPLPHLEDVERPLPSNSGLIMDVDDLVFAHVIRAPSAEYLRFYEDIIAIFSNILTIGVFEGHLEALRAAIQDDISVRGHDEVFGNFSHAIATGLMRPNVLVDEDALETQRQQAMDEVEPLTFQVGQNIVTAGDIITEEAFMALTELGYVDRDPALLLTGAAGSILIVTIIFFVGLLYMYLMLPELLKNKRKVFLLFTLYMMTLVLMRIMAGLPFYITPIMLFAMLTAVLLDTKLSIVLTVGISLLTLALAPAEAMYLGYLVVCGVYAAIIARYVIVRERFFLSLSSMALVAVLMVLASNFLFEQSLSASAVNSAIFALSTGLVTAFICIGSLTLWESIFEITTPNTLMTLTDPNNTLLRRLTIEAPGTYHHSLVVANLSEAACYDIGANHVLARVGAYFHDIGKMKYPQYFAENQNGENPHDLLPPKDSAAVIIDHVTRGLELARDYKLPLVIRDFIEQHHGTGLIKYFYFMEKKAHPDEEVNEVHFRYPFKVPQTRETAVCMLADTCEAAVRSSISSGKTADELSNFVRMLIKDKLEDGQLNESGLAIKDLDVIAKAFMRVFKGMYHERIPYPSSEPKVAE